MDDDRAFQNVFNIRATDSAADLIRANPEMFASLRRRSALECHPDKNGGSLAKMQQINASWDSWPLMLLLKHLFS